jgi:hypothetical protein
VQVFPVKPGDFALGFGMSRAAARAKLESRNAGCKRIEIICSIPRPFEERISIGEWMEAADGH